MSENLTVVRPTSHLSVEKKQFFDIISYRVKHPTWFGSGRSRHTITNPNRVGHFTQ